MRAFLGAYIIFIVLAVFLICITVVTNIIFFLQLTSFTTLMFFASQTYLVLYFFFEIVLLPVRGIILLGGRQPERTYAFLRFVCFSLFRAFPLLWYILSLSMLPISTSLLLPPHISFFFRLGFIVKAPVFIFHYWLPKAHVEASTLGSILLAGVLLKLGSWGLFLILSFSTWRIIEWLCILGIVVTALLAIIQRDIKRFIAFSSVCHINFLVFCLLLKSLDSKLISLLMNYAHAITSSLLFWVGGYFYHYYQTRQVAYLGNIGLFSYSIIFLFFIVLLRNFSVPPLISFFSEYIFCLSIISRLLLLGGVLLFYIILVCYYNIYLFTSLSSLKKDSSELGSSNELLLLIGAYASFVPFYFFLIF